MKPEQIENKLAKSGVDPEALEETLSPGIHKKMEKYMKHAGHGYTHTHVEHHKDGSHTVHHVHEKGSAHDVKHAATDLDALHDSMEDHLGAPNAGEPEANAGQAGPAPAAAAPPMPPGM